MLNSLNQFKKNIEAVKELDKLYTLIISNFPTLKEEAKEILRAEIALSVSALDSYIHDIVRVGMIEVYNGTRPATEKYKSFPLPIRTVETIANSSNQNEKIIFLESAIREINSKDSYQSPKGIEYAMNLIDVKNLWSKLSPKLSESGEDLKKRLSLIINRRNKIVHEADFDLSLGSKIPIDQTLTNHTVEFIEKLCISISEII